MFNFCPSCASSKITFSEGKVFRCPDCWFVYYHNNAAATGCLIVVPPPDGPEPSVGLHGRERLVFTVRGKEPAAGKLDLPGGFVDHGEGIYEGLCRELKEELGWTPPIPEGKCRDTALADVFRIFSSFHNVYHYKGINYNTCDMYFYVCAPGLTPEDFQLDKNEISEVRFLKHDEIDYDQFAFESTKKAVKAYYAAQVLP